MQSSKNYYLGLFSQSKCLLHVKLIVSFRKIAALQLVEQGKVQLDSPVHTILPELANPVVLESSGTPELGFKPAEHSITLRQLLNHSSGLAYDQPLEGEPLDGLPFPLASKYDEHDPISRFNNLVKVGVNFGPPVYHYEILHTRALILEFR